MIELNERRKAARERLEQYKAASSLLEPFHGEDAGLQGNLVTRNGEVEKELERMRMLMLRVERSMMGLDAKGRKDEMDIDIDEEEDRNVLDLLA